MLKEQKQTMTRLKIGRWFFDIISLGVYFWTAVWGYYNYNIFVGILSFLIMFLFLNEGVRRHFIVKPYNAQADIVNLLEIEKITEVK